jgi:hypothetical protein
VLEHLAASAASLPPSRGLPLAATPPARASVDDGRRAVRPRAPAAPQSAAAGLDAPGREAASPGAPGPVADGDEDPWSEEGAPPPDEAAAFGADFAPGPPPGDPEDGPPLEELEAQMRGELAAREVAAPRSRPGRAAPAPEGEDEEPAGRGGRAPLPPLDELVARLDPAVREALEELFRTRFVSVKRLSRRDLTGGE